MNRCLAPDCQMGGLGCDNMTVVFVCFLNGESYEKLSERCKLSPLPLSQVTNINTYTTTTTTNTNTTSTNYSSSFYNNNSNNISSLPTLASGGIQLRTAASATTTNEDVRN